MSRFLCITLLLFLLAACAPAQTQPVTTGGGTPVTNGQGTPVEASVTQPMGECDDPILADTAIVWPQCKIEVKVGQVMVLPAAVPAAPVVDGLGRLGLYTIGQALQYLTAPAEFVEAYAVPYGNIMWTPAESTVPSERVWVAQSSREASRSLAGLNIRVTIALTMDYSPGQPLCEKEKPWNAFQVTFHLTRGSGVKWGPSIHDSLGHCVGGFDADVLGEIKGKISAFLSMLGAEGAELLKTLTGLY